jgi:hypothetical protein
MRFLTREVGTQREGKPAQRDRPKHIEIWEHFVDVHRMLKRMVVVMSLTTFIAVAGGTWLALVALHRPVVYYVDSDGRAAHGGRLDGADVPHDVEARYVAKQFLRHKLAFNSLSVESDLAAAWNLMTDELREEQAAELAEYAAARGYSFVSFVKQQQIRTVLDFDRIELQNHHDRTWAVRITGLARTWPLNRVGEEAGYQAREFDAQLTLVRVPRTELSPNGLLVATQAMRFFEPKQQAQALEETVPAGDGTAP